MKAIVYMCLIAATTARSYVQREPISVTAADSRAQVELETTIAKKDDGKVHMVENNNGK